MEIIYNNQSADAPSSYISQKLVVLPKYSCCYMRLVSMGLAGGLSLMVLGDTSGVEEAVATRGEEGEVREGETRLNVGDEGDIPFPHISILVKISRER